MVAKLNICWYFADGRFLSSNERVRSSSVCVELMETKKKKLIHSERYFFLAVSPPANHNLHARASREVELFH
eukprot:m.144727 g.144727  ORF g.144727 m.144727 type:complete len:72 (-) comp24259_c2_seq4:214-429(-)